VFDRVRIVKADPEFERMWFDAQPEPQLFASSAVRLYLSTPDREDTPESGSPKKFGLTKDSPPVKEKVLAPKFRASSIKLAIADEKHRSHFAGSRP
jgi:hypothetical protein